MQWRGRALLERGKKINSKYVDFFLKSCSSEPTFKVVSKPWARMNTSSCELMDNNSGIVVFLCIDLSHPPPHWTAALTVLWVASTIDTETRCVVKVSLVGFSCIRIEQSFLWEQRSSCKCCDSHIMKMNSSRKSPPKGDVSIITDLLKSYFF